MAGQLRRHVVEPLERRVFLHAGHEHVYRPAALDEPVEVASAALPGPTVQAVGDPRLPDFIPLANASRGYVYGWRLDTKEIPGRTLLRLSTAMANGGAGPAELRGGTINPNGTQNVNQRVYLEGGGFTDRLAGTFTYHPSHNHTHFDDFAAYRLRTVTAGDGVGGVVAFGDKVSFCLLDIDHYAPSLPGSPATARYVSCDTFQGISVGWADVYDQSLPDQWIDVTDVPDGHYWLEVVADPANHLLEADETNNTVRIQIDLAKPSQDPMVLSHVPNGQFPAPAGAIDFNFDQAMDPTSFDPAADVTRFTGPGGVDLRGAVTGGTWLDADTLRVTFATQGAEGPYAMAIGPQILAADDGAAMDQDRDKMPGEAGPGHDEYVATFVVTSRVGPDAFGYEARAAQAEQVDLEPGGPGVITLLDGEDDSFAAVALGTNTFNFYGTNYTGQQSLFVSTNGLITFARGSNSYTNGDLTVDPSSAAITPLWDDWRTDTTGDDAVLARFDDVDGDGTPDRLVIEWNEVRRYLVDEGGGGPDPDGAATFQAILTLNTGATVPGPIVFNYVDLDTGDSYSDGGSATVGIKASGVQGGNRLVVSRDNNTHPLVRSEQAIRIARPQGAVVGRYVFYNNSGLDNNDPVANADDDRAIATDKVALRAGSGRAVFANVSSSVRGINGIMLDVAGLPPAQALSAADFTFRAGTAEDASTWPPAPAPAVAVRRGAGAAGSDRVTLVWPDGAIFDQWLQVTLLANARTRLAAPDVFYFGHLCGETGDNPAAAAVNALDLAAVKRELNTAADVTSHLDFNRDGRINALDLAAVRTGMLRTLPLLTLPDGAVSAAAAALDDNPVTSILS